MPKTRLSVAEIKPSRGGTVVYFSGGLQIEMLLPELPDEFVSTFKNDHDLLRGRTDLLADERGIVFISETDAIGEIRGL